LKPSNLTNRSLTVKVSIASHCWNRRLSAMALETVYLSESVSIAQGIPNGLFCVVERGLQTVRNGKTGQIGSVRETVRKRPTGRIRFCMSRCSKLSDWANISSSSRCPKNFLIKYDRVNPKVSKQLDLMNLRLSVKGYKRLPLAQSELVGYDVHDGQSGGITEG